MQSDPIGLGGGTDTFGYVEANPLSKFDVYEISSNSSSASSSSMDGVQRVGWVSNSVTHH